MEYDGSSSEETSVYDLVPSHTKSPILTAHDLSTNSYNHGSQSAGNPTRSVNFKKEEVVPEKQRLSFNGFIGDFKQFRDWKGSEEDSNESDDDVISIEETYREVGQYKSQ